VAGEGDPLSYDERGGREVGGELIQRQPITASQEAAIREALGTAQFHQVVAEIVDVPAGDSGG
jgi:hypothetical protein